MFYDGKVIFFCFKAIKQGFKKKTTYNMSMIY